ncbi:MAG: hypothetical protein ABH872_02480 [Candidatus Omnitrophota bacterium]
MKRKVLLCAAFALLVVSTPFLCTAQKDEKITLTTYYPAPYGVYKELVTNRLFFDVDEKNPPQSGIIGFLDTDNNFDQRLRITAGNQDTGNNSQGAAIDLHGNAFIGKAGDLDLVAGAGNLPSGGTNGGVMTFWTGWNGAGTDERMRIDKDGYVYVDSAVSIGTVDYPAGVRLTANGGVKIGNVPDKPIGSPNACDSETQAGTVRYNTGQLQFCNDSNVWVNALEAQVPSGTLCGGAPLKFGPPNQCMGYSPPECPDKYDAVAVCFTLGCDQIYWSCRKR